MKLKGFPFDPIDKWVAPTCGGGDAGMGGFPG